MMETGKWKMMKASCRHFGIMGILYRTYWLMATLCQTMKNPTIMIIKTMTTQWTRQMVLITVKRCFEWHVLNVTAHTAKCVPRGRHTTLVILKTEHPGNANVAIVTITYLYFIASCQYLCHPTWMSFCIWMEDSACQPNHYALRGESISTRKSHFKHGSQT